MNPRLLNPLRAAFLAALLFTLHLGTARVAAQPGGGPPGGMGFMGMDPQQIQEQIHQRIVSFFRDRLEISNDEEWGVVEKRLDKVLRLKGQEMIGGMFMGGGMGGGPFGGGPGGGENPFAAAMKNLLGMDQPEPELDTLRRAIESHANAAEMRAAVAKVAEMRQRKKAEIGRLQDDLRKVLTFRQEATLTVLGVMN